MLVWKGVTPIAQAISADSFTPHPNELSIWAYPENLVKIGLMVEAMDTLCGTGGDGEGRGQDAIV